MCDPAAALVRYIDARLASMERSPGTWGTRESLELQALLLLELRTFVLRRRTHARNPYETRDAYMKLVRERFPETPGYLMSALLPQERAEDELPGLLGELRREVVGRLGPEDPFAYGALVLEVRFAASGKRAPFSAACRYFSRFQRAVRAFARVLGSGASPSNIWLAAPELRVLDGEGGARVLMIVDDLAGKEAKPEEHAGAPLRALMDVLAWVAGEVHEPPAAIARGDGAHGLREHVRRLVPRGRVASVRLGGTAAGRAPIVVEAVHIRRVDALIGNAISSPASPPHEELGADWRLRARRGLSGWASPHWRLAPLCADGSLLAICVGAPGIGFVSRPGDMVYYVERKSRTRIIPHARVRPSGGPSPDLLICRPKIGHIPEEFRS